MRTENIHSNVTPHSIQRRKRQFHRLCVEEVPVFKDDYQDMDDFEDPKETKERMKKQHAKQASKKGIRAIPFEILRGAEWKRK